LLAGAALAACSGEAETQDFGQGYPGGSSEPPPPTQRGESTPTPNFPECEECSNECFACLEAANGDDVAELACVSGSACQTYLAQYVDRVGEDLPPDNILETPDDEEPGPECGDPVEDPCGYCQCAIGGSACDDVC
jgi:hypothetical protein